jgi:pimeloyl-ACP methyl ester carboxylesterase
MGADPELTQTRQVDTADGRRLRAEVAGDGRRVVVVQVGMPNAGVLYHDWVQDAAGRGLTLITYDRPGYRGSLGQRGRMVADCAADVRRLSDVVGFERCVVWGFSAGGPHALACGALLHDLVAAVATIGSPAPFDAPGLDFLAGSSDEDREEYELFLSDRAEWERQGEQEREELLAMNAGELAEQWSAGQSAADGAVLHAEIGVWLHRAAQAALAPGIDGWNDDAIAVSHSPWGFDPASISIPVKVWHGREDRFVPFEHGRWLAETIPGAQVEWRDHDGHFTVVAGRIGEVHEWLAHYV